MTKVGKRIIQAADEALEIARNPGKEIQRLQTQNRYLRAALGYIRKTTNEDGIAAYVDEILEMDG